MHWPCANAYGTTPQKPIGPGDGDRVCDRDRAGDRDGVDADVDAAGSASFSRRIVSLENR
jgi:hypothetical protein